MSNHYYNADDLGKFCNIGEYQKQLSDKFFAWYTEVFAEGNLSVKEKSLIALLLHMPCNVPIALMRQHRCI